MSQFKNIPGVILFYTDTDSLYINTILPDDIVSDTELGKLKLVAVIKDGVFLGHKTYSYVTLDNKTVTKIKGLSSDISASINLDELKKLLRVDESLELNQEKWSKDLFKGFEPKQLSQEQVRLAKVFLKRRPRGGGGVVGK